MPVLLTVFLLCGREEWTWLQSHVYTAANGGVQSLLDAEDESTMESSSMEEFVRSLRAAVTYLLTKLNIPLYRVNTTFQPPHIYLKHLKFSVRLL